MTTEEMVKALQTKKKSYSKNVVNKGKEIYGAGWLYKFKRDPNNKEAFLELMKAKPKAKKDEHTYRNIINSFPVNPADWHWNPKKKDIPEKKYIDKWREGKKAKAGRKSDRDFYLSKEWRKLRVRVLEKYECKCMMCGRSPKEHSIVIHVDHIKPRSKYPELSLEFNNLQLLCEDCNIGKGARYNTNYRPY